MTTSIAPHAAYLSAQENLGKRLIEKYGSDR